MSQSGNSPIQFDCRFDPPVVPVGSDYSSILCAFTITAAQCAKLALQNCHLRGVHVGTPPQDFMSQLAEAGLQELVFIDDPGQAGEDTEETSHADSVCDALVWCEDWGRSHDDEPAHFIVFAHEQTLEDTEVLGRLIESTDRAQFRCDIFGSCSELDLRLLNQAAMLMGGTFGAPADDKLDVALLQFRGRALLDQRIQDLTVSIQWVPSVLPVHIFSTCEQPHFLRDLGSEPTPYVHRFFAGPVSPKTPPTTFIFRALVQRQRSGDYRVATVKVGGRSAAGAWTTSFDLVQPASTLLAETEHADAEVGYLADRLRPSLWWEEICQAFSREDGNHIVRTFESLISHEFEHRRLDSVAKLRGMRMEFIRGGYFGLDALGELWALTHRRAADE